MEKQKNIIFYLTILICILSIIFIIKVATKNDNIQVSSNMVPNVRDGNNITQTNSIKNNTNTQKQGLYIKEHYIKNTTFSKTIEGIVVNNTNQNYEYVVVRVQCYDKDNNKLESSGDSITNLNSKESWKFNIYINSETARYTINLEED